MSYQENPITIRSVSWFLISRMGRISCFAGKRADSLWRCGKCRCKSAKSVGSNARNAVSEWEIQQQQLAEQKAQEAANQVAQQDQAAQQIQQPDTTVTDQPVQQPEVTQPDQTQVQTHRKLSKSVVYATETMNIRQEPNEQSAVLASAFQGLNCASWRWQQMAGLK